MDNRRRHTRPRRPAAAADPGRSRPEAAQSTGSVTAVSSVHSWVGWWVVLGLIAINVLVYAPVRHYDFVSWDDPGYVTENPNVTGGLTWSSVRWAATTGQGYYWHPVTWISHILDVELHGVNAGGHHLTSLFVHIATTVLLFLVLQRMTGALGRSALVAALFAVHPLHVESVAWVAERKDV